MVLNDDRVAQLCQTIQGFPILWDPSREDFKEKDRAKGKAAKKKMMEELTQLDSFWATIEVKTVMAWFRGFKTNYAASMRRISQKSGDGREDVEKPSVYKHSEHLRFLDGIAIGNFGTQPTVTNVAENNTAEADLQRQESVHIDLEAEENDEALKMAGESLEVAMNEDELKVIQSLKDESKASQSIYPLGKTPTSSLKNTNKSRYTLEREKAKEQNKQLVNGFERMSDAVKELASSSKSRSPRTPKRPRATIPNDQFDAFGELVATRLRSIEQDEATDIMAAISGHLFQRRNPPSSTNSFIGYNY